MKLTRKKLRYLILEEFKLDQKFDLTAQISKESQTDFEVYDATSENYNPDIIGIKFNWINTVFTNLWYKNMIGEGGIYDRLDAIEENIEYLLDNMGEEGT